MVLNQRTILKMLEEGRDPFKEEEESLAKIAAAAEAAALKRSNLKIKKQTNRSSNSNEDSKECGSLLQQDKTQHDGAHLKQSDLLSAVKVSTSQPDETSTVKSTEKTKRIDFQKSSTAIVSKKVSKKISKLGVNLIDCEVRKGEDAVSGGSNQEIMETATTNLTATAQNSTDETMMMTKVDAISDMRRLVDISTSSTDDPCATTAVSTTKNILLNTDDSDADKQKTDFCVKNEDKRHVDDSNDGSNIKKNDNNSNSSNNYRRNSDDIKSVNLKSDELSIRNDCKEQSLENLKDAIIDQHNESEEVEKQLAPPDLKKSSIGKIKKRKKEEEEDISYPISSDKVLNKSISDRIDAFSNVTNAASSVVRSAFLSSSSSSSTTSSSFPSSSSSFPSSSSSSNSLSASTPNIPNTIKQIMTSSTSSTTLNPMSTTSTGGKIMKNKSSSQLSVPTVTGTPVWVSQLTRRIHANEVASCFWNFSTFSFLFLCLLLVCLLLVLLLLLIKLIIFIFLHFVF